MSTLNSIELRRWSSAGHVLAHARARRCLSFSYQIDKFKTTPFSSTVFLSIQIQINMFWGPRSSGGSEFFFFKAVCTISAYKLSRSICMFASVHLCWQCLVLKTPCYIILKATQKTYPKYTYSSRDFCLFTLPSIVNRAVIVLQAIQTIIIQITRQPVRAPNWLCRLNKLIEMNYANRFLITEGTSVAFNLAIADTFYVRHN